MNDCIRCRKRSPPFSHFIIFCFALTPTIPSLAQQRLQAVYSVPYQVPTEASIKTSLDRLRNYLDTVTPYRLVDAAGNFLTDLSQITKETALAKGDFRLTFYQWGVTYSGMMLSGQATGDTAYTAYAKRRLGFMADVIPAFRKLYQKSPDRLNPFRQQIDPKALDDAGSMCAAMVKAMGAGYAQGLRPVVNTYLDYITNKQHRLKDGTLARNTPFPNTLWLDDMYMSIPALAQGGALTGDAKYFDDATRQVLQFSQRMFDKAKGIYVHGWVQGPGPHPSFHWGRANGWAVMAMVELLDVLPPTHPQHKAVVAQLQAHLTGLCGYQSGTGLWHQLIDRSDTYLETSASAMFTFALARAINRGWMDRRTFGPACLLAWNALAQKINARGQVEGGCQGAGIAFDLAYYYYRPVDVYAEHAYGPMLLAGAEVMTLLRNHPFGTEANTIKLKGD